MVAVDQEKGVSPIEQSQVSGARVFAVIATLAAGILTGMIGYALADLQCTGSCTAIKASGGVIGALFGAIGVGIVATLALRATNEWRNTYKGPSAG